MAKKLSDLVIMSDVDGTLLTHEMEFPQRNIDAIRRFVEKGGRFGLSTGRSMSYTDMITSRVPINHPCVFSNGGMLYDFEHKEILWNHYLPEGSGRIILEVTERFPGVGVVVLTKENYYDVQAEKMAAELGGYTNPDIRPAQLAQLAEPWYKVLFLLPEAQRPEFPGFVEGRWPGVRFVATNAIMVEMLPEGCSKGTALQKLMELRGGPTPENLVCVGDYYNDQEMIQLAGIGATLRTSPADLQALAQMVLCPVEQGAVADLIEKLEALYES